MLANHFARAARDAATTQAATRLHLKMAITELKKMKVNSERAQEKVFRR